MARRLDLLDLASLNAQIEMEPIGRKGLVRVKGRLTAELTQACVVTLAPLTASIDENFELTFGPDDAEVAEDGESHIEIGIGNRSGGGHAPAETAEPTISRTAPTATAQHESQKERKKASPLARAQACSRVE